MKKKILLLSGYDAASHRYWRKTLAEQLPNYEWTQLALPDRHFYWRVRGNSLSFAFDHQEQLSQQYDLLIVTSMVDLSSLRGFCPSLAEIPTMVYFHENQFAYPLLEKAPSEKQNSLVSVQVTTIYTALCADKIVFNSEYNLTSFIDGAKALLKRLPDLVPKNIIERLESRAEVLPVPMTIKTNRTKTTLNKPAEIVWNHRWEYDKQPDVFFNALYALKKQGYDFKLHVLGQSFRNIPSCFDEAKITLKDEIISYGFQSKERYIEILSTADFIVSSAAHDFQGISLQEGMICGCTPIAPNRVAYPEYVPSTYLYDVDSDKEQEANSLFLKLSKMLDMSHRQTCEIAEYSSQSLIPRYRDTFALLME